MAMTLRTNRRNSSDNLAKLELVENRRLTSCIKTDLDGFQWNESLGQVTLGQTIKMPVENGASQYVAPRKSP